MPAKILDIDWVSDRYTITPSGCWVWNGPVCSDGYGKCGRRAGQTLAHRAFYVILVGQIPEDREIDHTCKNRLCVNPSHLEPVTHAVNVERGDYTSNHRNGRKTHCKRGHVLCGDNLIAEATRNGIARKCRACRDAREAIRGEKRREHRARMKQALVA